MKTTKKWGVRLPDGSLLGEKDLPDWSFTGHQIGTPCRYSTWQQAARKARLFGGIGVRAIHIKLTD